MSAHAVLTAYLLLLILETLFYIGLDLLNLSNLRRFSATAPPAVSEYMAEDEYSSSLAYSRDRQRFSLVSTLLRTILVLILLLAAVPGRIDAFAAALPLPQLLSGALTVILIGAVFSLLDIGLSAWSTFVIEERHGFNRTTPALFAVDLLKGTLLGILLGVPVLSFLIWSVNALGTFWWIWGFTAVALFQLLIAFLFPVLIAPLFYRFTPLEEGSLKEGIDELADKTGFTLKSIQVMDGSRRSGKANAFFTGFGRNKRIALFDTLLDSLEEDETIAVVAHELGHAKLKHTLMQLASAFGMMFVIFGLLALLLDWTPLFTAFSFQAASIHALLAIALYFSSPVGFWISPLQSLVSRRREYAADAFASDACGDYRPLADGLIKLHRENRSNPVPHPLYSFVHYSHPTVWERIAALEERSGGVADEK